MVVDRQLERTQTNKFSCLGLRLGGGRESPNSIFINAVSGLSAAMCDILIADQVDKYKFMGFHCVRDIATVR